MGSILKVATWEYLTRIKSKWFIISTLLVPLVMIGSMIIPSMFITGLDTESKIVGVVDSTGFLGFKLEKSLTDLYRLKNGNPKYQILHFNRNEIKQAESLLDSTYISAYLAIPEKLMKENRVNYFCNNVNNFKDQSEIQYSINKIVSHERMIAENLDPDKINELLRDVDFKIFEPGKSEEVGDEILSYLTPLIFVMMLFFTIFMTSQVLLRSVLQERTNRLVEILLSSITAREMMIGKILGLGLLGLTQLTFYLLIGLIGSKYQQLDIITYSDIVFFLIYFILGYLLYSSIYAAVGSIFDSEQDAQQVTQILSIVTIIPIMLSSFVISNPNSTIVVILSFIPVMTPFFMILRIGVEMPDIWQIIGTIVLLGISVVITMIIAGKIFKTAILLYGKRPTLPEIIKWIKV